jgi:hypothetical protein
VWGWLFSFKENIVNLDVITRDWHTLAPKLVAFLATGLTASGLIAVYNWAASVLGWTWVLSPTLATIIVGIISSAAAYVQRDNLLTLAPGQIAGKVIVFVLTSTTVVTVVAIAAELGFDAAPWAPVITAALTILGAVLGYAKSDQTAVAVSPYTVTATSSSVAPMTAPAGEPGPPRA